MPNIQATGGDVSYLTQIGYTMVGPGADPNTFMMKPPGPRKIAPPPPAPADRRTPSGQPIGTPAPTTLGAGASPIQQEVTRRTGGALPELTAQPGTPEYTAQLLARGNIMGTEASRQTGIPFTPTTYTPPALPGFGARGAVTGGGIATGGVTPTGAGAVTPTGVPGGAFGTGQASYDALIKQISDAISAATGGPTPEQQLGTLQEERGLPGLKETVGTFEDELGKAQDLLSDLDMRIRRGVQREEARLAPKEFVTGAKQELIAQAAFERGDILSAIDTLQRGKERAERTIDREEADILMILGLREAERTKPLEALQAELLLRKTIRDLTKTEIPTAVSSTFDDAGNLTIVTQDPNTGAFRTQTIQGIGKKAAAYSNFSTQTDQFGNVTIIGIKPDGTTKILGSFEGVAGPDKPKAATEGELKESERVEIENKLLASRGTDGFVDPRIYQNLRSQAKVGPDEFNKRFSHLLSTQERKNLQIGKAPDEDIDVAAWTEEQRTIIQQYLDAGWNKEDTRKKWMSDYGVEEVPKPIEKIFDEKFGTWVMGGG